MTDPVVVKIGGGLLREHGVAGMRAACDEVARTARDRPVLVVPGGGAFADAVRAVDAQVGLADAVAHALALEAMDQFGRVLATLLPGAALQRDLRRPERLAILTVVPALGGAPDIPASWAVTSDSLAVLAAGTVGAREAVLLKAVAGVLPTWPGDDPPIAALSADELAALQAAGGGRAVDAYLPEAVRRTGVLVTVRSPGGTGTRIS